MALLVALAGQGNATTTTAVPTLGAVAVAAVAAGATIVNDVSASLHEVAADLGVGWVAMHMRGDPRTMQDEPVYDDVVAEDDGRARRRHGPARFDALGSLTGQVLFVFAVYARTGRHGAWAKFSGLALGRFLAGACFLGETVWG